MSPGDGLKKKQLPFGILGAQQANSHIGRTYIQALKRTTQLKKNKNLADSIQSRPFILDSLGNNAGLRLASLFASCLPVRVEATSSEVDEVDVAVQRLLDRGVAELERIAAVVSWSVD